MIAVPTRSFPYGPLDRDPKLCTTQTEMRWELLGSGGGGGGGTIFGSEALEAKRVQMLSAGCCKRPPKGRNTRNKSPI
eukprot:1136246-Amphidinium_carterae.1